MQYHIEAFYWVRRSLLVGGQEKKKYDGRALYSIPCTPTNCLCLLTYPTILFDLPSSIRNAWEIGAGRAYR